MFETQLGGLATGLAQGIATGQGIRLSEEENKRKDIQQKINILQEQRQQQAFQLEERKAKALEVQQDFENASKLINDYLINYKNISGTPEGQKYLSNIQNLPFLNKYPQLKEFATSIAGMDQLQAKEVQKGLSGIVRGIQSGNKDVALSGLYYLQSISGAPGIQNALNIAKEFLSPSKSATSLSTLGKYIQERNVYEAGTPESEIYARAIEKEIAPKEGNLSELEKEINARNKYSPGSEEWNLHNERINKLAGALNPYAMTDAVRTEVQKNTIKTATTLSELKTVKDTLTPDMFKFMTIPGKLTQVYAHIANAVGYKEPIKNEHDRLKFKEWLTTYMKPMAEEIKRLKGAAYTTSEQKLSFAEFPTISNEFDFFKYFKSDTGPEFVAKLDGWIKHLEEVNSIEKWMLENNTMFLPAGGIGKKSERDMLIDQGMKERPDLSREQIEVSVDKWMKMQGTQ